MRSITYKDYTSSFQQLLDLGEPGIEQLREALASTGPSLAGADRRALLVCKSLGKPEWVAKVEGILADIVFHAHDTRRRRRITPDEYYRLLTDSIDRAKGDDWPEEYKAKWKQLREPILGLFGDKLLAREAKARFVLETRPNRVRKLRLFTDLRPLFEDESTELDFDIVTNTLCIDYNSNDETHTMYFSLDSGDLGYLEEQIARAKQKNEVIESVYGKPGKLTLTVPTQDRSSSQDEGQSQ